MSKKSIFIVLGIVGILSIIWLVFPRYSLKSIKNKLANATKIIVCDYNKSSNGIPCKDDDILKTLTNKDNINEIIEIINSSSKPSGVTILPGAKYELFMLDKNNKTIASLEYANFVLKKGYSSYSLENKNIKRIGEIIK